MVIGEPIGSGDSRQQTAVGETPNLAARLQGLAGPNQVVIDAATRRQIGGLFECQDLGTVELKGLPVRGAGMAGAVARTARSANSRRCVPVPRHWSAVTRRWSCCSAAGRRRRPAADGWC